MHDARPITYFQVIVCASAATAAAFLIVNGLALPSSWRCATRPAAAGSADPAVLLAMRLTWRRAVFVGTARAAGLIPGLSRSAFGMGGGV